MRRKLFICLALLASMAANASNEVVSPDGRLRVELCVKDEGTTGGSLFYRVAYNGDVVLEDSPLGLLTNIGDFRNGLSLKDVRTEQIKENYSVRNIKQKDVSYEANELVAELNQGGRHVMDVEFRVSNRDVAFRYRLFPPRSARVCVVQEEASGFSFVDGTTTFLCPQSKPMGGFARTSPS